jgi:hypothetical protein
MQIILSDQLKKYARVMQGYLFPVLEVELDPLTDKFPQPMATLNLIRIETSVGSWHGGLGRIGKEFCED